MFVPTLGVGGIAPPEELRYDTIKERASEKFWNPEVRDDGYYEPVSLLDRVELARGDTPKRKRPDLYSSDVGVHEALWEAITTDGDALALIVELMQRFDTVEGIQPEAISSGHVVGERITTWVELARHLACQHLLRDLDDTDDRIEAENRKRLIETMRRDRQAREQAEEPGQGHEPPPLAN